MSLLEKDKVRYIVAAFVLAGCAIILFNVMPLKKSSHGKNKPTSAVLDLEDIVKRGKLVAATGHSSTGYFIYRGQPMGYRYELLKLLAKNLGVKLEIIVTNDLREGFGMLQNGTVDILAVNLARTPEREKIIDFTVPIIKTREVLVQRKPNISSNNKNSTSNHEYLSSPDDLAGKTIYIPQKTSFLSHLKKLSRRLSSPINIVQMAERGSEELIDMVAEGDIDYTVADEQVASVNCTYYNNIDADLALTSSLPLAWGVRKTSPHLKESVNQWLTKNRKSRTFILLYKKYFHNARSAYMAQSDYNSLTEGRISIYDEEIKKQSQVIDWDWRLLSSLVCQESRFNCNAISWAGAFGLMQLMPETAEMLGVDTASTPYEHIRAGARYLKMLDKQIPAGVTDKEERAKLIIASYNIGLGHILDARRLAKKYGKNPNKWNDNVEYFLLQKSKKKYYTDPLVRSGYCRGTETVAMVRQIIERYHHYKNILEPDSIH